MLDEEQKHKYHTQTLIATRWSYRLVLISCSRVMHITPNLVTQTETKEAIKTQQSCHAPRSIHQDQFKQHLPAIWVEDGEHEKMSRSCGTKKNVAQKRVGEKKMSRLVPQTRAAVLFLQKTS